MVAALVRATTLALLTTAVIAQAPYTPATLVSGSVPEQPAQATGGGEVLLELTITDGGTVGGVAVIRSTPPFTELVTSAVSSWQFAAAEAPDPDGLMGPVESRVLVAAAFRPPTLTPGPGRGEAPQEVGVASPAVPYPDSLALPGFPPGALFEAVVLLELALSDRGTVTDVTVIQSGENFDEPAVDAVRQWRFQPATRDGRAVPTTVAALVGFRQPITLE